MPNTETILMTPISIFSQKYAPRYTPNDTEFLGHLGVIHKQTWKYNKRNAKQFRVDLRAALGNEGKLQNFITTRQNTQIGQKLNFYRHRASSTVSKSFWRQLPKTVLYKPGLYRSCSVVGSSGLLKGSLCGNHIDKADFIFRFNLAPINGFKDDVGRKTNFTTLNPSFVRKRFNWLKTPENCSRFGDLMKQFRGSHLWLPAFALRSAHTHLMKVAHMVRKTKVATPIFGHPDHYTAVGNLWERTLNGTRWTTTGLHVLTSVFDLCHRIDVFGFWPFPKSLAGEDVPYHYHDSVLGVLKFHSFTKEFRGIMKLHELGIINVHLGPCT
ncbi:alpha-N-acetylneuraminide alpha-2,8-sialyltransferase-like isoform X2 [Acanthaster planci]|nr:alpha-N-acetylneuraminide alpha-2,8-sialyltransferase-like isoform X2 [Acanthaster planci]XP_022102710.1 alpha-N-acetylneuraminide alpha-2,8-sialyltransferase-like isoform X2 [Acanthaster planci]